MPAPRLAPPRLTAWWPGACALAALALVPSVAFAAGGLTASASVSPPFGGPGLKLVATYAFAPKHSCAQYHDSVSWSFGNTPNWATGPAPSASGSSCASSTPPTAPPSGYAPGSYAVCGTEASVTPTPACTTYTIKPPAPGPPQGPNPTPPALPSSSPASSPPPSPSPSATPGGIEGSPSPSASPGGAPPGAAAGGGSNTSQRGGDSGRFSAWPWVGLLLSAVVAGTVWRFRSWLMGVFENVEVMGRSGADLETELLHHETSDVPEAAEGQADPEPPPTP